MNRYHHCPCCTCEPPKRGSKDPIWMEAGASGIIEAVSAYYGVPVQKICSKRRTQHIAAARQVAMYLIYEHTGLSFPAVGEILGRDHSTVIHGHKTVKKRITPDTIERIRRKLEQISADLPDFQWKASA